MKQPVALSRILKSFKVTPLGCMNERERIPEGNFENYCLCMLHLSLLRSRHQDGTIHVKGIRPGREVEEVGEPPEHNVGLIPGKERGKADRVRGRRSLRLQPSYKNVCSQAGGEPLSQNLP